MSLFVDRMLLQLSDPAQLAQLLTPTNDTGHIRLFALLNTMYNLEFATIHDVQDVKVNQVESQRLFLTTHQMRGVWRQTAPHHLHTDIAYEGSDKLEPIWLDIAAQVQLKLLIEVDSGKIQSISGKVQLMDAHELEQVMIQLQPAVPFDPQAPANIQSYTLNLAIFIRETLDVAATLHDVKLARAITQRVTVYQKQLDSGEVVTPYAPIVIFPQDALNGSPFKDIDLQTFFAREGVLALFMTPA